MNILATRRSFLAGVSAFSLSGCVSGRGGFLSGASRLKFGVISDIHITDWNSTEIFRKTLRWYRDQGVDAVMIVGDLADHGLMPQLENVAKAWYEAFPGDRAPDGRRVEKLFVYGNHDPEGLKYRDKWMDEAFAVHGISYEEADGLQFAKGRDRDGKEAEQVRVSFPAAVADGKARPFDYELTLEARENDVEAVVSSFRFYSPTAMLARSRDGGTVEFALSREELPKKAEFRFAVRALNSYGVKGVPVFSDWRRVPAS